MGEATHQQVLRYWLACVRMEEALAARPRARRTPQQGAAGSVELGQPVEGLEYLRVDCDGPTWALAERRAGLQLPMDAAGGAFFETWLSRQYRSGAGAVRRRGKKGGKGGKDAADEGDDRVKHMLAFPVVHLPRQELAGLLRCDVELDFLQADGAPFEVPGPRQRRERNLPPPPVSIRVDPPQGERQGRLPFFVDTRLLHDQLGVEPQEIDAFFEGLLEVRDKADDRADEGADADAPVAPLTMLAAVTALLAGGGADAEPPPAEAGLGAEALMLALVEAMNRRLRDRSPRHGGPKAYGVGILMDAQQARSTWHLQRELELLLAERPRLGEDGRPLASERPALDAYLRGPAPGGQGGQGGQGGPGGQGPKPSTEPAAGTGAAPQRAAYPGSGLTPSQRAAAERFLGSTLSAVQGPPGTGKTTLILHLAAEHILEQVDALVDRGQMGYRLMVVASTNNRAVDNVIEPLNLDRGAAALPLALRTGSREVCQQVTVGQLREAMTWLSRKLGRGEAAEKADEALLAQRIDDYRGQRAVLVDADAWRVDAMGARARQSALSAERAALVETLAELQLDPAAPPPEASRADLSLLERVPDALEKVSSLSRKAATPAALKRIDRAYGKFQRELGAELLPLLTRFPEAGDWPLPPRPSSTSAEAVMEAWEDAVEEGISVLEGLVERVAGALGGQKLLRRYAEVDRELADCTAALDAADAVPEAEARRRTQALDPERAALFEAALAVREAWAAVHAKPLHEALQVAVRCVGGERSMRTLFRAEDESGRWLRRLCSVWGCTLLSMANAVPAESRALYRVVIDEAGQCHPAHAVSALMRCQHALVVGDVHQLQPVVGLTAQDEGRVRAQASVRLSDAELAPYRVFAEGHNSVQSLADRAVGGPLRLVDHFRCQPEIIALCDAFCDYGLTVHTARASRTQQAPQLIAPLMFYDIEGRQERLGGSWVNHAELEACMALLGALLRAGIGAEEVAVITPYRGQLELLQRAAAQAGIEVARGLKADAQLGLFGGAGGGERGLTLGTVHRFQGGERSVVLFSSVVTEPRSLRFLNSRPNLLNVTVSRAREHLVSFGHARTLAGGEYTRHLLVR